MGKTITKTVERDLMCRLTEIELEEEGRKLTDLLQEKMTLEVQKSASNKHYTDAIKGVDGQIEKQIPVVRDREIERKVACLVEYNVPEKGLKRVTRLDTNEVVETSEMTSDERQDLFLNAPEAENAPEAPAVKARPAPADENVIDAEKVIHVDVDSDHVKPEVGKIYEVNGLLLEAVPVPENSECRGCFFDTCPDEQLACSTFVCSGIHFRQIDASNNGEGADTTAENEHLPKVVLTHCKENHELITLGTNCDAFPEKTTTFASYSEAVSFVVTCLKGKSEIRKKLQWVDNIENTRSYKEAVAKIKEGVR